MASAGYYRFPAIHEDSIVFVSEDDLWTVSDAGGVATRLTANLGAIRSPFFSPDGQTLAFTGREEGNAEVYTMPARGGPVRRTTYLGVTSSVIGWMPDGDEILFTSDSAQPFGRITEVFGISPAGGDARRLAVGPAVSISVSSGNRTVLGRNNNDPARWKRYRGGTAGELWIDAEGSGEYRRLIQLNGNTASPMWIGDRIFFLSDHEGIGNLYSCSPAGDSVRRHTHRTDFFVRFPSTDGRRIVYHAGADLYIYDPATDEDRQVEIRYGSPRVQRQRKFPDAARYLESYSPHPRGHSVAINSRGKSFTFGNWEGAIVAQRSDDAGSARRIRLTTWLPDGKRLVCVADDGAEDVLEVHAVGGTDPPHRLTGLDIGRPDRLRASPAGDHIVLSNHRHQLLCVDLEHATVQIVDQSAYRDIAGMNWSPDGRWVAYACGVTQYTTAIKLWDRIGGGTHTVTEPVLHDINPAFDPEGRYLYFLGYRDFNPVYDALHFDLGFPRGMRPYLITLRSSLPSPFVPKPRPLRDAPKPEPDATDATAPEESAEDAPAGAEPPPPPPTVIDLEGITRRLAAFPVPEGVYGDVVGLKGKVLFTSFPIEGAIEPEAPPTDRPGKGSLDAYDLLEQKRETLVTGVTDFRVTADGSAVYYRSGARLRVFRPSEKPEDKPGADGPSRKNGWIDLGRVRLEVDPGAEWQQMAREAWRLQREYFWTEDMSQVDWDGVWTRYSPVIDRLGTRGEFSDLIWEMQGELGTSHAYEFGGDYRAEPTYPQGFLGADLEYDRNADGYRVTHIVRGAPGEAKSSSPLESPGAGVTEGDVLLAVNGRRANRAALPQELLVHQAGAEVVLTFLKADGTSRDVTVTTLKSEFPARYREWVQANRERVHGATGNRVGYVHIPDMGARGYAEFHRSFLAEVAYDGLIVDVRFNGGGHVSQLLIEKLARKRVGYDVSRWGQPEPYPSFSVAGPIVAVTNQWAGSDGDIFCHVFKLLRLGPLIGKRTWGGVIGISPRNVLADGTITTQPEFSFWFKDVGWGVENYGTDPDIDVDVAPQDYAAGRDPQLDRAIAVVLERLAAEPPVKPSFADRPNLAPPGTLTS